MGIWLDEQLAADPALYNWGEYLRIRGQLDLPRLQQAAQRVVATTDALRLRVLTREGVPFQHLADSGAVEMPVIDCRTATCPEEAALRWMEGDLRRPFVPTESPLFSFTLLQVAEAHWFFHCKYHHLIMDGMSAALVWRRMAEAYNAYLDGKALPPAAGHPWAEVVALDQAYARGCEKQKDRAYWQTAARALGNSPTLAAGSRPAHPATELRRLTLTVPPAQIQALRRAGASAGPTCRLNHILFALLALYLARLTEAEDLALALPRANRRTNRLGETAGMLTNIVVARMHLPMSETLRTLLLRASRTLQEVAVHERFPFVELVRELVPTEARQSRLFALVFNYLPTSGRLDFGGAEAEVEMLSPGPCRDLQVLFRICPLLETATLQLFFPANHYTPEETALHRDRLAHLLLTAPAHLDTPLSRLPLLSPEEYRRIVVTWNETDQAYPADRCLHELFAAQVERTPHRLALVDEERELTYEIVNDRADQIARWLRSQGIGPGSLVGLWDRWSLETILALLGIWKAGAAYVPLPAEHPHQRLRTLVADAKVQCVVSCESPPGLAFDVPWFLVPPANLKSVALGQDARPMERDAPRPWTEPGAKALACILYTSGTTGTPKGVCLTHEGLVNVLWHRTQVRFLPGDFATSALTAPLHFDASLVQMFSPLLTGGTLVVTRTLEALARSRWYHRLTALTGAPSTVSLCLSLNGLPQAARVIGFGAEPVSRPLLEAILASKSLTRIVTGYGVTECSCYSTDIVLFDRSAAHDPLATGILEQFGPCVIGRPIRNTQLYVLDAHMQPVPIGVPGELYIGGAGVSPGYLNLPELTAEKFVSSPLDGASGARLYRTGDRVRWRPDGNLEFLGRLDDQVKLRGMRFELSEIETVLATHPAVARSAVVLREDSRNHKRLVAYFTTVGGQSVNPGELTRHLRERLPHPMVPGLFVELSELPLTASGKVDRRALPAPAEYRAPPEAGCVVPRNATEEWLAARWAELLNVERVGPHDNFFDLGGDSLKAIVLFSQIERDFHHPLPASTLLQAPTVADLAHTIDQALTAVAGPVAVTLQPAGTGTPLYLLPSMSGDLFDWRELIAAVGTGHPLKGLQYTGSTPTERLPRNLSEIAAGYVAALLQFQPLGPYHLAGYSFGGMLAYEMARQLKELDRDVGLVAIVDTQPGLRRTVSWSDLLYDAVAVVRNFPRWVMNDLGQQSPRVWWQRGQARVVRTLRKLVARFRESPAAPELPEWYDTKRLPPPYRARIAASLQAVRTYQPATAPLRVTVFRARTRPLLQPIAPDLGWGSVALGGVEVHEIPGHHGNLLREPQVRVLAESLLKLLDRRTV